MLDITTIREQFPALQQTVNQQPLIYLDSAATTQKPQCVIDVISHYYSQQNANVHRGSHSLTAHATSQLRQRARPLPNLLVLKARRSSGLAEPPKPQPYRPNLCSKHSAARR
ncbi:cysteine desulfurase CsdA-CsdE [Vibrio astriarenae]|nr:cysteine desulfurase CsdA-CsdE [Vibrio sp. C7]